MSATLSIPNVTTIASTDKRSRWLSVVTHTEPRYGGLSTAVPRLGVTLRESGRFDVSLAAFCLPNEQFEPEGYDGRHLNFWPATRSVWLRSQKLRQRFARVMRGSDAVHIHGLWEASTLIASRMAFAQGKPYLLSAHGMLEPWALAQKRMKKLAYASLFERRTISGAACLHALTQAEADQYRAFGARCPIAIVPNAASVPAVLSAAPFFSRYPHLRERRVLLFLGRLHPKKGLNLLIEAWSQLAKSYPEAHLVVAGPDSEGTASKLQALIASRQIESTVTFTGMLDGEMKWSALAAAECFLLPSFSEGLSMSVLEALGAGVPVIITRNCNMPAVSRIGAGWEIAPEVDEARQALQALLQRAPEQNREMGMRGAQLIATRYQPSRIALEMGELYEFVANGRKPRELDVLQG